MTGRLQTYSGKTTDAVYDVNFPIPDVPGGKMVKTALGRDFATRSGDKGGNANVGIWGENAGSLCFFKRISDHGDTEGAAA